MNNTYYAVMDGRIWTNPERALVLVTAETLEEAIEDLEIYSKDYAVVEMRNDYRWPTEKDIVWHNYMDEIK